MQAVTNGSGPKAVGSIDFAAMGCTAATVFDKDKCQKIVKDGKDGKAFLREAITSVNANDAWDQSNITTLIPEADLKRVYKDLQASEFDNTRGLFGYLSTSGNGWFKTLEGVGKAKVVLQRYLESLGNGGLYSGFQWPFDTASPEQAQITEAGVKIRLTKIPAATTLRPEQLYYWALQTDISDMAYPPGFASLPPKDNQAADFCKDATASWGHVGIQYAGSGWFTSPTVTTNRFANWGGGGDGSGKDDYGCGGSNGSEAAWVEGQWYEYKIARSDQVGPKLWKWQGSIVNASTGAAIYDYTIYGGQYITRGLVWTELLGTKCTDSEVETEWTSPYFINSAGKFRVGRIDNYFTNDACLRSRQEIVDKCNAQWKQSQGAPQPAGHATAAQLRLSHKELWAETNCARPGDATEIAIAKAYVQAISGGTGAKSVSGAVDFARNSCGSDTVWDEAKCQAAVFNGLDGKTILMNAISPVGNGGQWRSSNILQIIPQADMQRIMTDSHYAKAKDLFGYMSDPGNNWYTWAAGDGKAKDILRCYMASVP